MEPNPQNPATDAAEDPFLEEVRDDEPSSECDPAPVAAPVFDGPRRRIEARDLRKTYGGRRVVDGVHVGVEQGEIVGLLGPNGAGKTTTFYMITGMIRPDAGKVFLDGKDISGKPMYRRSRLGLGYLAQEPSIFRALTVRQNVEAVLEVRGIGRRARRERCDQLLEELRISHLHKSVSVTLSGGERRRLEIARALACDPAFLLLDEPFAGVDPIAIEDIQGIVAGLRTKGLGILITDHNVRETLAITDRAYILFGGRILTEGSSEFLANDEQARKAYLGERFSLS
jgi:lipopolysaccharide export system ATP-binding protein